MESKKGKIYLGIDPGTRVTGYGLVSFENNSYSALDYGCVRPPPALPLPDRYLILFDSVSSIIERFKPDAMAIETQFVSKNCGSALKLGMARGAIMVAARKLNIPLFEYSPTEAKKGIVGHGSASKEQVQKMVMHFLNLSEMPKPLDASDALSLALCAGLRAQHF
ncbi:crossover junction endodeoxyribonuclease RuvC [Criblamydia sequanensis]|uniref:Crossover junction endodeoxyribonuclease RuvC n=1 Tax=Candidatus Criblamydia sequanensis CRIB-18 TaxID=1437425 RepID=A0A090E0K6_9BACT|nr:crossover junction endodeoxyribonuclease RuvC [Criblamydia sequanensis]CDR34339.1 Crossover junction endodeoxyribonuclease RuvC [Criblamydia sequanensis CRIB-18]